MDESISSLDETLSIYLAKTDLINEKCYLKHGPSYMDIEIPKAVDYLCQYFGWEKDITEQFRIPICSECIEGLYDRDWILIYCIICHNSQWIYKPYSRLDYHNDVIWLDNCPKCSNENLN